MDIMSSIAAGLGIVKSTLDLISQIEDLKHQEELVNAKISLVELKGIIVDSKEVILEKDEQIKRLNELINLGKKMTFNGKCYEQVDANGYKTYYCSRCFDKYKNIIHLTLTNQQHGYWDCPECKNSFFSEYER